MNMRPPSSRQHPLTSFDPSRDPQRRGGGEPSVNMDVPWEGIANKKGPLPEEGRRRGQPFQTRQHFSKQTPKLGWLRHFFLAISVVQELFRISNTARSTNTSKPCHLPGRQEAHTFSSKNARCNMFQRILDNI